MTKCVVCQLPITDEKFMRNEKTLMPLYFNFELGAITPFCGYICCNKWHVEKQQKSNPDSPESSTV